MNADVWLDVNYDGYKMVYVNRKRVLSFMSF